MKYVFQLFVSGRGSASIAAFRAAKAFCEQHLPGRYQLWVVNVLLQPELVPEDVVATPTLLRVRPRERRQVIGDLSDGERLRRFFLAEESRGVAGAGAPAARAE